MNVKDYRFRVYFGSEEDCRTHFKRLRDERGITCEKCGSTRHYWQESRLSYECKKCNHRTSLRNGTVLENSNLPLLTWYKTIFLLCLTKEKISSYKIQKLTGHNRYEPILKMRHKLDSFVDNLQDVRTLEGIVEKYKDTFEVEAPKIEGQAGERFLEKQKQQSQFRLIPEKSKNNSFYFDAVIIDDSADFEEESFLDVSDHIKFDVMMMGKSKQYRKPYKYVKLIIGQHQLSGSGKIEKRYLELYFEYFIRKLNAHFFEYSNFTTLLKQATNLYD